MKVGIYTIHRAHNYGAMLQAYATQYVMQHYVGVDAEIVNYYPPKDGRWNVFIEPIISIKALAKDVCSLINPFVWLKCKRFREFHAMMSRSARYRSLDELYAHPPIYDVHVVGSDQVWNLERGFPERSPFWLEFLPDNARRISYGSSFGRASVDASMFPRLKEVLCKFSAISVREDSGVRLIKEATALDATQVLDPTLLLSEEQWKSICEEKPLVSGKYILYYGFDKTPEGLLAIEKLRKMLDLPLVVISVSPFIPLRADKFIQQAGPLEFLNLFANATFVATGSFHGTAFAVNFHRDFIVIRNGKRMARMESLLKMLGLSGRIVNGAADVEGLLIKEPHVNYSQVDGILFRERRRSLEWLKNALGS